MRIAPAITLSPEQRTVLESQARSRSLPVRVAERARIVLLAASGQQDKEIAARMAMTPKKVSRWRKRFLVLGIAGLEKDAPRSGLKPHRVETFKISNDPQFAEKLEDIVGLYLNPPEHALVLCVDEKSQIQALDRTQPGLPLKKGRA